MAHDLIDPPSLYDTDVLAWSEQQASLLRERRFGDNALDWDNIVEEIEDVGKNVYRACRSQLDNILIHLLKIEFIGPAETIPHWKREIANFRLELERDLTPTIRAKLQTELGGELSYAIKRLTTAGELDRLDAAKVVESGYTWDQITDDDWYPEPRNGDSPPP